MAIPPTDEDARSGRPGFYLADSPSWVSQYLDDCEVRLSPETVETYRKKLAIFTTWWQTHASETPLTGTVALAYDRWLTTEGTVSGRPVTERSRGLHLSAVRRWCAFLVSHARLQSNPFTRITVRRADWLSHGFLKFGEVKRLLRAFDDSDPLQFRDYLLALLMLRTGAREGELSAANLGDLSTMGQEGVLLLRSKGKQTQEPVLLRPDVKQKLDRYLLWRQQTDRLPHTAPLFVNLRAGVGSRMTPRHMRRRIKQALRRAGLTQSDLSAISLRHTAAFQALLNKAPLKSVQLMMRHESIETTKVFSRQLERLRQGGERYLDHLR